MAERPWYKEKLQRRDAVAISALCLAALVAGPVLEGSTELVVRGVLALAALVLFVVAIRKIRSSGG